MSQENANKARQTYLDRRPQERKRRKVEIGHATRQKDQGPQICTDKCRNGDSDRASSISSSFLHVISSKRGRCGACTKVIPIGRGPVTASFANGGFYIGRDMHAINQVVV